MTACVYLLDQRRIEVTGTGYASVGKFQDGDNSLDPKTDEHLTLALRIGMLCNDAKVERTDGHDTVLGDPTEAALIVVAEKAGMNKDSLAADSPRISEVPFDSTSKRMITVHRGAQGPAMAFVKGAPGTMIAASSSQMRATGVTPSMQKTAAAGTRPTKNWRARRCECWAWPGVNCRRRTATLTSTEI